MEKETVESVSKWAEETFGICNRETALRRAYQEIAEFREELRHCNPHGSKLVEEAADVCITLYRYIYLVDPDAIEKKMKINRERKWKVSGGVGQHIKEGE